jgi:hypothetical protein
VWSSSRSSGSQDQVKGYSPVDAADISSRRVAVGFAWMAAFLIASCPMRESCSDTSAKQVRSSP